MSWRKVNLGDLVDNFSVKAKNIGVAKNLEFWGVSNEHGIIKTKYAAQEKANDYKIIEKECFAYNPYRINVGSIGLFQEDIKGLISPAYVVFKPKPKKIVPELLLKFLKSEEGLRQIKFYARGTVRQALRFEDLCKIELSLPDYDEQITFFNKLREHQEKSDLLKDELINQLSILSKLRQQILQDAVQGKLVPQDPKNEPASVLLEKIKTEKDKLIKEGKLKKQKPLQPITEEEIPFNLPNGWVWCRLGEVGNNSNNSIVDGPFGSSINVYTDYVGSGVPVIRMVNVKPFIFLEEELKYIRYEKFLTLRRHNIHPNDVLLSKVGAGIGETCIYPSGQLEGMLATTGLARFRVGQIVLPFYLTIYLNYSMPHLKTLSQNTAQPFLNMTDIKNYLVSIPPFAEQKKIVLKVKALMTICDELEETIKLNQKLSLQLLQSALKEALEPK